MLKSIRNGHELPTDAPENHAKTVRDSLSRNLMVDMIARIGYLLSRFLVPPFILAHVGLEAYGLWATAFILVSYVGVSTMGISNVYVKFTAEYTARRAYKKINELLSTGLMITVPAAGVIFAALWWCWPLVIQHLHIAAALRNDAQAVVLSVVAIFLASISLSAFRDVLTGCQKSAYVQAVWVIGYLIETALIFCLVGSGYGVRGLAEAFLIRTAIEIALSAILAFHLLPWLRITVRRFSREAVRTLVSFGGVVQIQSLLAIGLNSVERAIAAPLIGLAATGLLDISNKLPSMAASLPSAFAGSFMPAASYLKGGVAGSEEQREAIRKLYLKGARYMNLTCAYICGFIGALALPLLDVWMGKRYSGAALLTVVFTIQTQVHLMTGPGTSILKGVGRPREEFRYALPNIVALLLALPVFRLAMGRWTAFGIGTAVTVATLVAALYFLRHANRVLGIRTRQYIDTVVWPGLVPYLVGLIFTYPVTILTSYLDRWSSAGVLLITGLAYTTVLAFVTMRFVFETGERLWFQAILASKFSRFILRQQAVAQ